MLRRPPRPPRSATLCPYTTLFRSPGQGRLHAGALPGSQDHDCKLRGERGGVILRSGLRIGHERARTVQSATAGERRPCGGRRDSAAAQSRGLWHGPNFSSQSTFVAAYYSPFAAVTTSSSRRRSPEKPILEKKPAPE